MPVTDVQTDLDLLETEEFERVDPPRLTENDMRIFDYLLKYRVLRSDRLRELVRNETNWGEKGTKYHVRSFQQRLTKLADREKGKRHYSPYIERVDEVYYGKTRYYIYALTYRGAKLLDPTTKRTPEVPTQLYHHLEVVNFLTTVELAVRAQPHLELIEYGEIVGRSPVARKKERSTYLFFENELGVRGINTDGLFGIRNSETGEEKYFFLEADRATEVIKRRKDFNATTTEIWKKWIQYFYGHLAWRKEKQRQKLERWDFNLPNWRVLFTTPTTARARYMRDMSVDPDINKGEGYSIFMFGNAEELTPETVLNYQWQSVKAGEPFTQTLLD